MRRALILLCLVPLIAGAKRRAVRAPSMELPGRDYDRSVVVAGLRHDYHVYLPSSYDGVSGMPLLFSFHGGGGNAAQGEGTVGLRSTAEKHGFILVRPEGYDRSGLGLRTWNAGSCCSGAVADRVDHVGAVRAILDQVEQEWRVDTARVFATGHSNGGMMAYRLACELGHRIAAVAPNAAALLDRDIDTDPPAQLFACSPPRGVPLMHMHGDADTCSPMAGGVSAGFESSTRPPVAYGIARFVAINQASATPRVNYQSGDVTCVTYDGAADADVVLCLAKGGGHAWPGAAYVSWTRRTCGGAAITGMDANEAIWEFFRAHPMPR